MEGMNMSENQNSEPESVSDQPGVRAWLARNARFIAGGFIVFAALMSACVLLVVPGEAIVITRLGDPVRVLTTPGVAFKIPAPIETTVPVDLRLKTTSSGLQDVGTRDGLRILVQAYVAWQVPDDPEHIRQFLRAVQNQPDVAAEQLRSFIGSLLEITTSSFDLADLVNTDAAKIRTAELEDQLRSRIDQEALKVYGISVLQVGIERMTLPTETLDATVERMRAERATVAAQREAEGEQAAALIISNAERDARVLVAQGKTDAAAIDAKSRVEAADIYAKAYANNRELYTLLRSLDALEAVINGNTRLILRTDAAPFRVLVDGPGRSAGTLPAQVEKKP